MPDTDSARGYLAAARRDAGALVGMSDEQVFPLEIFGFHVQQAIEKAIKAWLCLRDIDPPPSHNLRHLLVLLENSGVRIDDWWDVVGLTAFAVQFRYEAYESIDSAFDRNYWQQRTATLIETVQTQIHS